MKPRVLAEVSQTLLAGGRLPDGKRRGLRDGADCFHLRLCFQDVEE